jgi:hypothetical protein
MPFRHARARLSTHDMARCPILHTRFLVTSLRLRESLHVIFLYPVPLLLHAIDCSGDERCSWEANHSENGSSQNVHMTLHFVTSPYSLNAGSFLLEGLLRRGAAAIPQELRLGAALEESEGYGN